MSSIETKSLEFGLKLFKMLSNGDNTVFSPFSLTNCLSLVLMGIRSTSSQELSKAMFGKTIEDKDYESFATQLKALADKCLEKNWNAIIWTNLMYSDSKFQVLSQFKQLIQRYFSANIKELDLSHNKCKSVDVINSDIRSATNGKIDKLLEEVGDQTVMVLVNALYFKGLWKTQFIKQNTITDKFMANGGQQMDVQMMHSSRTMPFGYNQHLKARAVELDYENTNAVMIVLLPDIDSSLQQMRNHLSIESINDLVHSLSRVKVDLWLPRFKIESTYDLVSPLYNIGIKAIFNESGDFSGLSAQKGLYVSQVIQKAIIEVNEEGTEATAANTVVISYGIDLNEKIIEFRANRPFMYLLVTKNEIQKINSILFIGEVNRLSEGQMTYTNSKPWVESAPDVDTKDKANVNDQQEFEYMECE